MKNIRIYYAGGFGMNIGSMASFPGVESCYIDSSRSNQNENVDQENVLFVKGIKDVGGSGGHRANNYRFIAEALPGFLDRFPPADLNIVVFSKAGGTGSVAGPLIMGALLKDRHPAVAVTIGDKSSKKYLENTINTMKSLEGQSASSGLPFVMSHHDNTNRPRGEVDQDVLYSIEALVELGSQKNADLDVMDVTNFFQYSTVVNAPAQLMGLTIYDNRQLAAKCIEPVAIASLYTSRDDYRGFGDAKYTTYGFAPHEVLESKELHYVINQNSVEVLFNELNDAETELMRKYSSQKQRRSFVDPDDNMDDSGMVL